MANDLETTRKVSNFKTKKLRSIVDFSALVSLSFLLIMFFMLTSAMQRPQTMDLSLPDSCDDCGWNGGCWRADERMITLLLDSNDNIVYYLGMINFPYTPPTSVNFGQNGIRKTLLNLKSKLAEYAQERGRSQDDMIVIIKPSKKSNYKNLVDILDEMAIVGVKNYSIVNDFSAEEIELIQQ